MIYWSVFLQKKKKKKKNRVIVQKIGICSTLSTAYKVFNVWNFLSLAISMPFEDVLSMLFEGELIQY